jgi:internalin A
MTPEEEAYAEALRRIREAEANGAVVLDLSKLSALNRLPPELERLGSLQTFNLSGCKQLRGDLAPLTGLTSLQSLDLSANQLSSLAPEITKLTSLQSLDLSANRLSSLPPEITKLTRLQSLALNANQLNSLPPEITKLTSLQSLDLGANRLSRPAA